MVYAKWIESLGRFGFSLSDNDGHPITEAMRNALLAQESMGKVLAPDADGFPVAIAAPGPTVEQLTENERVWRDQVLSTLVWLRDRHRDQLEIEVATTLSAEQFKQLLLYMQALRDWPQSLNFPDCSHRPIAPLWLSDLNE
ncbi:phage tail assembly chaperone [Pseudomonas sp. MF4836]|uniref:phage tail assembly chaperone n=1 Tax=Pseudomonas sp. MF4836 TaxID=1960827 RepID=UPI0009CEE5CB|nr:phage tail assembly chaperone [Pseudomonas sp. MF4836]OOV98572.1 hypothetical protein MF4836_09495 [Pseudomonas sp. MF4836]